MKKLNLSKRNYLASVFVLGGVVLVLAMLGTSPSGTRAQERRGPVVITPDYVAFGSTYGEWSAAWWQWAFSIPVASHPLFDNADCSTGQSGAVWFLGTKFCIAGSPSCSVGSFTRSCSLPAGKAIFFPVTAVEDSAPEEPAFGCGSSLPPLIAGTIAELRQCAAPFVFQGVTGLRAEIDGEAVRDLKERFHVQSPAFVYTLPADNLLNAIGEGPFSAGTYSPAAADGVYVMLSPLRPGSHVLEFSCAPFYHATYNLVVE
jgi:hypothetical protein